MLELLLKQMTVDVNAKNNQLQTPLDNAIKFQKHKTIKLLRKHGGKTGEGNRTPTPHGARS